jgi:hypothetical protein
MRPFAQAEEFLEEIRVGVLSPSQAEGEIEEVQAPGDDRGVVELDTEHHE